MAVTDRLRSIDLYLSYPAGTVVRTSELQDVGCGMYLCYYTVVDDEVWAATSATELIFALGSLKENPSYNPPEFLETQPLVDRLLPSLPASLIERTPDLVGKALRSVGLLSETYWDESVETIDERIAKLQPFERVTPTTRTTEFSPTLSLTNKSEFVDRSVTHITDFIHTIERAYPDHHHIVRVGGMDSQLILLVPKLNPEKWSAFSAEPNYDLVTEFIEANDLPVSTVYHHTNENEETPADVERKLICSDLKSDPHHLRWYPTLDKIVNEHNGNVIFWDGTEGDTLYSYHLEYQSRSGTEYFDLHRTRAANWQAVTHQVTKNYTGAAALSPFHSEAIWNDLYQHYNPDMISKGVDLRYELGEQFAGQEITWPTKNPGPAPYEYNNTYDSMSIYTQYIKDVLAGDRKSVISVDN